MESDLTLNLNLFSMCTVTMFYIVTVNIDSRYHCKAMPDGSILFDTIFKAISSHTYSFSNILTPPLILSCHLTILENNLVPTYTVYFQTPIHYWALLLHCPSNFISKSCYSFFRHCLSGHLTFRIISDSSR